MKALKWVGIALGAYVAIIVVFESMIGFMQPAGDGTLVIATADEDGTRSGRVVSRITSEGQLYVAANHWPRAWYQRALENPSVEVTLEGKTAAYQAVPVSGSEHDRVDADKPLGAIFRLLTGFPPRYFLRLDPVDPAS